MAESGFANTNVMTLLSNGRVGIGITNPNGLLSLFSSNQLLPRLILSGQEFFQDGNTATEGIALLCGVNRAGNRQLWIGDSAILAQNSTTSLLRLTTTNIDCISTNGLSVMPITIGNSGGINIGGILNMGNNQLNFDTSISDYKINLWGGVYGIGIRGSTLAYFTQGVHNFYNSSSPANPTVSFNATNGNITANGGITFNGPVGLTHRISANNIWNTYTGTSATNLATHSLIFNHVATNINSSWWFNGTQSNTNSEVSDQRSKYNIQDFSALETIKKLKLSPKRVFS